LPFFSYSQVEVLFLGFPEFSLPFSAPQLICPAIRAAELTRSLRTLRVVSTWRGRFARKGLAGLADQPRPGPVPKDHASAAKTLDDTANGPMWPSRIPGMIRGMGEYRGILLSANRQLTYLLKPWEPVSGLHSSTFLGAWLDILILVTICR
jgi:hypothetical protein